MAKACYNVMIDAEECKRGKRPGLDTQPVHAVNDPYLNKVFILFYANALSMAQHQYTRKGENEKARRFQKLRVKHAV